MTCRACSPTIVFLVASLTLSPVIHAQPLTSRAVALTSPARSTSSTIVTTRDVVNHKNEQSTGILFTRDVTDTPAPDFPDPHDGNYAKPGAIVGALTMGVGLAVIFGLFTKRDCNPGFCGTEFQRGALVGGGVGLAAGGVLGWLIGSSIERPAPAVAPPPS
jgi:hypothetical protein